MKTNKKGFTLIEILAAVTILGILSAIAIVSVNKVIQNGKKKHYETAEENLMLAGQNYAQQNRSSLPKVVGQKTRITLKQLVNKNYIKAIKDYNDNECDLENSYVQVFKYSQTDYSYIAYLECPAYTNKEEIKEYKPTVKIEITGKEKSAQAKITVEDSNKLMSYSYIVYKGSKEVKNSGSIALPKYDTNVEKTLNLSEYTPGNLRIVVTATNIYGNSTTETIENNFNDTAKPNCIIQEVDKKEKSWTNTGNIKITVGCDDGEGSGCTRKTYSKTFKTTTEYGEITIADEAGNTRKCKVSVFLDKDAPTIPTKGKIGKVSGSNVKGTIKTAADGSTDAHSGLKEYRYLVTNTNTTPTDKTLFTTNMNFTRSCGTSYYAWAIAVDNVGNMSDVKSLGNTSDGVNKYSATWTTCTKKCGTGTQTRTNSCALVTTGLSQKCNEQACCSKTEKKCGAYGDCSKTCGTGSKTRTCKDVSKYDNSITCKSSYTESANCNTRDCCSSVKYVDGTTCSKTCGGGTYNRLAYSNYNNQRCSSEDKASGGSSCNTQACSAPSHTHTLGVYGTTLKSCGYKLTCGTTHSKAYYGYCGKCWNYGIKKRISGYYCPARGRDNCQWKGAPLYETVVPD